MNIVFWGTPKYSVNSLNKLYESGHNILAVITQPDRKRGRGKQLIYSPIKERALELNIKVITPNKVRDNKDLIQDLKKLKADIFIVVAFGQILTKDILEIPPYGCWNSHCSLLPKWRGAAPIQWSIINGDKETGVGIMFMEEGLDTGPIIIQEKTKIYDNENSLDLSRRLSMLSSDLLIKALNKIKIIGKKIITEEFMYSYLTKQDSTGYKISYARMINKEDNKIDWTNRAISISRKIYGLYPNAYSNWKGKRIKIQSCIIKKSDDTNNMLKPGTIVKNISGEGILVKAQDKLILINSIQIEGKRSSNGLVLSQQMGNCDGDILE